MPGEKMKKKKKKRKKYIYIYALLVFVIIPSVDERIDCLVILGDENW